MKTLLKYRYFVFLKNFIGQVRRGTEGKGLASYGTISTLVWRLLIQIYNCTFSLETYLRFCGIGKIVLHTEILYTKYRQGFFSTDSNALFLSCARICRYGDSQCCGSGSGIRCLFDPWIRDPEWVFSGSRISDPGS
jgi:hypothetical protein